MGRNIIGRLGFNVDAGFRFSVMDPNVHRARDISDVLIKRYLTGEYTQVYVVFTEMITPFKQIPVIVQLLPLKPHDLFLEKDAHIDKNIVKYEPDANAVFDHLVPHYIMGVLYGAFVEAFTCEQTARMIAMDGSTKSADEMIEKLTLQHNRARQAHITQEVTEIVSGIPD
jgi:F-type H+-transporting ATPase subunit gamma